MTLPLFSILQTKFLRHLRLNRKKNIKLISTTKIHKPPTEVMGQTGAVEKKQHFKIDYQQIK